MAALNIAIDIPQNPTFDVEDFRNKIKDYAAKLIINWTTKHKQQAEQTNAESNKDRIL